MLITALNTSREGEDFSGHGDKYDFVKNIYSRIYIQNRTFIYIKSYLYIQLLLLLAALNTSREGEDFSGHGDKYDFVNRYIYRLPT